MRTTSRKPNLRRDAMKTLFQTDEAWSSLILRVMLGIVMLPHGAQKLLGWFGGFGFAGTMGFFTDKMHLPWIVAFLVIMGESFGSLGLIVGFLTRFSAFGVLCIMLGAIYMVHWPNGFFMNWFGKQAGAGVQDHPLDFGMSLPPLISAGGSGSVDGAIAKKLGG